MSERTFRTVVAAVLVGALALAVIVAIVTLLPAPAPTPSPSVPPGSTPTLRATPAPTPVPGPVFETPGVVGVWRVARGSASAPTLVLEFVEPRIDAIPNAPGTFLVAITDSDGDGSTVAFTGTPVVAAPGSLGATARLVAPNALIVEIVASDPANIEPITITGLGITAGASAAVGPMRLDVTGFTGSLAAGTAPGGPGSPGSVAAGP